MPISKRNATQRVETPLRCVSLVECRHERRHSGTSPLWNAILILEHEMGNAH